MTSNKFLCQVQQIFVLSPIKFYHDFIWLLSSIQHLWLACLLKSADIHDITFFSCFALHCCSVAKSHSTLWPHGLQHARLPCPSPSPGVCSNSFVELVMPSSHLILCHPLPLPPSIFPASGSLPVSQLLASGGQSIGASASVLPILVFVIFLGQNLLM